MNRKILNLALGMLIVVASLIFIKSEALAKTHSTEWNVSYDGKEFTSDYNVSKSTITSVMPGDTIEFSVGYKNDSDKTTDFYVNTDIINSLEDKSINGEGSNAAGGGYSFKMDYVVDGNSVTIFNNETIGGDNATVAGLRQIQGSLDDNSNTYFAVGQLIPEASGTIKINIKLDGNSQDNLYMSKLATLDVKFGAEQISGTTTSESSDTSVNKVVYVTPGGTEVIVIEESAVPLAVTPLTGDSILPIVVCSISMIIGILFVIIYFVLVRRQREEA